MTAAQIAFGPLSPAERKRRQRSRERDARAATWLETADQRWHPLLTAWAARGLRLPPTAAQLAVLAPYMDQADPRRLGQVLRLVRRFDYRRRRTTYGLIAAVRRGLEALRHDTRGIRDAFERPLSLDDPRGKRERGERREADRESDRRTTRRRRLELEHEQTAQHPLGTFDELMARHGLTRGDLKRKGHTDGD